MYFVIYYFLCCLSRSYKISLGEINVIVTNDRMSEWHVVPAMCNGMQCGRERWQYD